MHDNSMAIYSLHTVIRSFCSEEMNNVSYATMKKCEINSTRYCIENMFSFATT